jgi:hypothetical protein
MVAGALLVFTGTAIAGDVAVSDLGTGSIKVSIGDLTYPIAIIGSLFGLVKGWKPVVRHELVIITDDGDGRPVTQRDLEDLLARIGGGQPADPRPVPFPARRTTSTGASSGDGQ